jgi:hypothetical protein
MRTTIDIHDPLLERAKRFASGRGKNLADVVNDALSEKLGREERPPSIAKPFQVVTFGEGGLQPGIDLNSNADLQDALDEELRDPVTGKLDLNRLR